MPLRSQSVPDPERDLNDPRARLRDTGILIAGWSAPAVLNVAMEVLMERRTGHLVGVWPMLAATILPWYVWAPFTPLVKRLVRRFPLRRPIRLTSIAAHLALCAVATVAFVLAMRGIRLALGLSTSGGPLWATAVSWSPFTVLAYAAVAAIAHAGLYARHARDESLQRALLAEQLTRAQLDALRMQLHPHFLFNALNTIAMLVRDRDSDTAVRLIAELGGILRALLRDSNALEVPLRDELVLVGRCLTIEQVRFGERLAVHWDVDEEVLDAAVPPLILQPVVENAIRHGIAHRTSPGMVRIGARARGDTLVLTVHDDGPIGPPPWVCAGDATLPGGGVGLANTRARLERLYGEAAYLRLSRTDAALTLATITVPLSRVAPLVHDPEGDAHVLRITGQHAIALDVVREPAAAIEREQAAELAREAAWARH